MKLSSASAALLLLLLVSQPTFAADVEVAPEAAHSITMTGEGKVSVAPDRAVLSAGVVSNAPTASAAVNANAILAKHLYDALEKVGVQRSAIRTDNFSLAPQYAPGSGDIQQRPVIGYNATNTIKVTLDDVTRAGPVMDALLDAGANRATGVQFSIKDPTPYLDQARAIAAKDAANRAKLYAETFGVKLGPIITVHEGNDNRFGLPIGSNIETVVVTGTSIRAGAEIAPGEQTISAQVTATWRIAP